MPFFDQLQPEGQLHSFAPSAAHPTVYLFRFPCASAISG